MKAKIKALLLSVCVIAILAAAAVGAMAYFTDTESATNTFTVGSVRIKLNEAAVNTPDPNDRNDTGNEYHLLPGHTYVKDPQVYVINGSSEAYIRMLVKVEGYDELKNAFPEKFYPDWYTDDGILLIEHLVNDWHSNIWMPAGVTVDESGKIATYEFRYYKTVDASDETVDVALEPLFKEIKIPAEIDNDHLAMLKAVKIHVYAHAIQAPGFEDADAAWTAFDLQNPANS